MLGFSFSSQSFGWWWFERRRKYYWLLTLLKWIFPTDDALCLTVELMKLYKCVCISFWHKWISSHLQRQLTIQKFGINAHCKPIHIGTIHLKNVKCILYNVHQTNIDHIHRRKLTLCAHTHTHRYIKSYENSLSNTYIESRITKIKGTEKIKRKQTVFNTNAAHRLENRSKPNRVFPFVLP